MARAGEVLLDPTSGRRLIFRRTSAQTGGRLTEYAVHYGAHEPRPEPRVDHDREHLLEVVEGSLMAWVAGRVQRLAAGDVLLIDTGQPHAVWNGCTSAAVAVWQTFPCLDTEAQIEARCVRH
jgi:mannose-6-phosphate isomerase-like protein (cupin superfamily)